MRLLILTLISLTFVSCSSKVTSGETGIIDKEKVRRTVRSHMKDYRNCFDAENKKDPSLTGKIIFVWEVNNAGEVENINIKETTLNNPIVESCVTDAIKKIKFPSANTLDSKTAKIIYPFYFQKGAVQVQYQ